ncbi:MAG: AAA family ATPase [Candidatus Dormibacteria bacterium]
MSEELDPDELDLAELDHEKEPDTVKPPWRAFLPKSLADRALEAVADCSEQVREMVESTIEARAQNPEDSIALDRWLGWVAALPWGRAQVDEPVDMEEAAMVLDAAHRGDDQVKQCLLDRIVGSWMLELAHSGHNGHRLRPLLLVGPSGTGKSSLARAVAEAIHRPCAFVSVPTAVNDGIYLVGCSRAYRDGEPGVIMKAIRAAGTTRLVVVLDELDKVMPGSSDDSRSAASSLLELLDGHATWTDRFLELPFDLSEVLFIAIANELATIQPAGALNAGSLSLSASVKHWSRKCTSGQLKSRSSRSPISTAVRCPTGTRSAVMSRSWPAPMPTRRPSTDGP